MIFIILISATDSICPKGWEMARYSGDGSYRNLLVDIYGKNIIAEDLKSSNGQTDSGIKYLPISLLRAGFLRLIEPHIVVRNSRGDYWIPHVSYSTSGHNFDFHGSGFSLENASPKGYGYSLRCVAKPPLLFLKKARNFSPTSLFYAIIKITVRDIYNLVERRKRWKFLLKK